MDEDIVTANSELRYITVELMKIAAEEGKTFEQIADEYVRNVFVLKERIANGYRAKAQGIATRR